MVMLSNSTVWLHSNKVTPLPSIPSTSSVRAFERRRSQKTFLMLPHSPPSAQPCYKRPQTVCGPQLACVCLCVPLICGFYTAEHMKEEDILLPALQYHWQRETQSSNQACSWALRCGWILMFVVWISVEALKSALLLYTCLLPFPSFSLFLIPSPFCTLGFSSHSKMGILCLDSHITPSRPTTPVLSPPPLWPS